MRYFVMLAITSRQLDQSVYYLWGSHTSHPLLYSFDAQNVMVVALWSTPEKMYRLLVTYIFLYFLSDLFVERVKFV